MISSNPSFRASSTRFLSRCGALMRPVSDTSPIKSIFLRLIFFLDDTIAAMIARSIPGSLRLSPRAILVYTSLESRLRSACLISVAIRRSSLVELTHRLDRFGYPNFVYVTSDSTSIRSGRVPSIVMQITDHGSLWDVFTNSMPAFLISWSPSSSIRKRAISSVGPNRFLRARRMR